MSTPYSESELTGPEGSAAATIASARDADTAEAASAEAASAQALAVAASTFAGAFDRWASRKATEAGASVPRLRLLYQVHCHGPQKMADLADALAVTPRNVTALVDGLESEGLVRRVPHSTDRRVTLVELTCNSDRVAAQFGTYQASIASLFVGMSEDERRTLLRLLGALHDRMRAEAVCSTAGEEASDA
jgi:DNA-binding MarR family transcriptional regulator